MTSKKVMKKLDNDRIDITIQRAMTDEGWLVPVTETQVEIAEVAFEANRPQLPAALLKIPALPQRGPDQHSRSEFLERYWTHHSVLLLTSTHNPVDAITERARDIVMQALEKAGVGHLMILSSWQNFAEYAWCLLKMSLMRGRRQMRPASLLLNSTQPDRLRG